MKSIVQSPSPAAQLREFLCNHILQYNVLCCSHCYCEQHAEPLACIGPKFSSRALRLQLHMFHLCVIVCLCDVFWFHGESAVLPWSFAFVLECKGRRKPPLTFSAGRRQRRRAPAPRNAAGEGPEPNAAETKSRQVVENVAPKMGPKNGPQIWTFVYVCIINGARFPGLFLGPLFVVFFCFLTPRFWDLTQAFACLLLSVT